jgi:hypothetical protein
MANNAEFQWTTYAAVLGIAAAGYVGWAIYPAFSDNMELAQSIHAVANEAWRLTGKAEMEKRVMEACSRIGHHLETPPDGTEQDVPGLPVGDGDLTVDCSDRAQDCTEAEGTVTITVKYTRRMPLPWLKGKFITLHFGPTAHETLKPADWH